MFSNYKCTVHIYVSCEHISILAFQRTHTHTHTHTHTQHQYTLVIHKPASSAAKVMNSTKVIDFKVDKDKLKPVDPNDVPGTLLLSTLKIYSHT